MRYDEIRQHVQDHFREMLGRFREGVAEAGPPNSLRQDVLIATQSAAESETEDWAEMAHPDGAAGLVSAFCGMRGIPEAALTNDNRAWLLDSLRQGYRAYAVSALGYVDTLDRMELDLPHIAVRTAAEPDAPPPSNPESYQEVLDKYFMEFKRGGKIAAKTEASKREALALLGEITDQKPIGDMSRADARQVKETLLKLPANRNKLRATRGKPLTAILDLPELTKIAVRTVNSYISNMQSFFGWAVSNGYATENIFDGTRVKLSKRAKEDV